MSLRPLLVPLLLACAACTPQPALETATAETGGTAPPAMRTRVTDLSAFDAFIATQPTVAQLRARYPGLLVVLPGDLTTKELRTDNSRFFAELDAAGRVVGGRFQ